MPKPSILLLGPKILLFIITRNLSKSTTKKRGTTEKQVRVKKPVGTGSVSEMNE